MDLTKIPANKNYKNYKKTSYIRENFITYKQFYENFNALNLNKIKQENLRSVLKNFQRSNIFESTQHTDTRIVDEIMSMKDKNRDYVSGEKRNYATSASDILSEKNLKKLEKIIEKYPTEIRFSDRITKVKPTTDYFERIPTVLTEVFSEKIASVIIELLNNGKLILAGGFISGLIFNTPSRDIDLFLTERSNIDDIKRLVNLFRTKNNMIYTDGICLKIWNPEFQVDLVMVKFDKTHDLINTFDLSCSMFAYTKGKLYYNTYSMYTVCTGSILTNNVRFLSRSPVRLIKYLKRGFSLNVPFESETLEIFGNVKMYYIEWCYPKRTDNLIIYGALKHVSMESSKYTQISNYKNTDTFAEQYELPIFHYGKNLGKFTIKPKSETSKSQNSESKILESVNSTILTVHQKKLRIRSPNLENIAKSTDVYHGIVSRNNFANTADNGFYDNMIGDDKNDNQTFSEQLTEYLGSF